MKLYGHPHSACTRKVLLALAEKGHEIPLVHVDLMSGEHNRPAHLARHPFAKIPVLEDGAYTLYESSAILRYLDQKLIGLRLTPTSCRELGRMEQWLSVERAYLAPAAWTLLYQLKIRARFGERPDPSEIARAQEEVSHVLGVLDRELTLRADKGFLAGYTYTLADVCFMPTFQFLVDAQQDALIDAHAHVKHWWSRVRVRPAFRAVVEARIPRHPSRELSVVHA
jgi:glutathione S-transferase